MLVGFVRAAMLRRLRGAMLRRFADAPPLPHGTDRAQRSCASNSLPSRRSPMQMSPLFSALFALLAALSAAQYNCALCPASGSLCCDCCITNVLQLGLCNDVAHLSCFPSPTGTATASNTATATTTASPTRTSTTSSLVSLLPYLSSSTVFTPLIGSGSCIYQYFTIPPSVTSIMLRMWGAGGMHAGSGGGCETCGYGNGGAGAYMEGQLLTTPGETLRITVGAAGGSTYPNVLWKWRWPRNADEVWKAWRGVYVYRASASKHWDI